jgi:hypothetical protein
LRLFGIPEASGQKILADGRLPRPESPGGELFLAPRWPREERPNDFKNSSHQVFSKFAAKAKKVSRESSPLQELCHASVLSNRNPVTSRQGTASFPYEAKGRRCVLSRPGAKGVYKTSAAPDRD